MFARALVRRFPVLAFRDFRLLLAERLLAPAAFGFSLVGVSFAVLYATGSTAELSYVLAAQIAPAAWSRTGCRRSGSSSPRTS